MMKNVAMDLAMQLELKQGVERLCKFLRERNKE